jgi:hypothetical protein
MKSNKVVTAIFISAIILCLWVVMIFVSPFTIFGATDPFYRQGDDPFDVDLNFPIIKPYYASALPKGFPLHNDSSEYIWRIDLQGRNNSELHEEYIDNILKMAVENGIILLYAPNQTAYDAEENQVVYDWFIIKPMSLEELGFENQAKLDEYLKNDHLNEPKWQDPNYLHDEFNMTGCLSWYPSCRKIPPIFRFPPSLFETY